MYIIDVLDPIDPKALRSPYISQIGSVVCVCLARHRSPKTHTQTHRHTTQTISTTRVRL